MSNRAALAILLLLFHFPAAGRAESEPAGSQLAESQLAGHLKYQLNETSFDNESVGAASGADRRVDHGFDARLNYERQSENVRIELQGEALASAGNEHGARIVSRETFDSSLGVSGLPDDDRRLFNLTTEILDGTDGEAVLRLDRVNVQWTSERYVLRVGRQAISWGNGLVFQVNDPFNPFAPGEIDKDYKTGEDMIYGQWLSSDGSDLQLLGVGRRDAETSNAELDEGSFAGKWRQTFGAVQLDLLAAEHFGEELVGFGLSRDLLGAVLRSDVSMIRSADSLDTLFLVNLDRSWIWLGTNWYGFVEYYYSELGSAQPYYLSPKSGLRDRLARSEVFTLGKSYVALGARLELAPQVNLYANEIQNLGDSSGLAQMRVVLDTTQDSALSLGANFFHGKSGTEFGGPELDNGALLRSPSTFYLRFAVYF